MDEDTQEGPSTVDDTPPEEFGDDELVEEWREMKRSKQGISTFGGGAFKSDIRYKTQRVDELEAELEKRGIEGEYDEE